MQLDLVANSISISDLGNDRYRFDIVGVSIFDCGKFTVYLHEKPEAILGQTVCIESHIYPDDVCVLPNYNNAIIEATAAVCLGDSVRLQLQNTGGNMQQPKKYIVIEDQVIRQSSKLSVANKRNSYRNGIHLILEKRIELLQNRKQIFLVELGDKYVTAAIEGCRPNPEDPFSTGNFITPYPNYDGAPYFSTDCKNDCWQF
jgi:hypothetical protein